MIFDGWLVIWMAKCLFSFRKPYAMNVLKKDVPRPAKDCSPKDGFCI
jgi:hypothetical protein